MYEENIKWNWRWRKHNVKLKDEGQHNVKTYEQNIKNWACRRRTSSISLQMVYDKTKEDQDEYKENIQRTLFCSVSFVCFVSSVLDSRSAIMHSLEEEESEFMKRFHMWNCPCHVTAVTVWQFQLWNCFVTPAFQFLTRFPLLIRVMLSQNYKSHCPPSIDNLWHWNN